MVDIIHWIISFGCFCSSFSNPRYLHYPPFPRLIHHQFLLLKNNDSNKAVISKLSNFQLKSRAIFGWLYIIDMKYFIQYSRMILSIIQISFRLTKKLFSAHFRCTKFGKFDFRFSFATSTDAEFNLRGSHKWDFRDRKMPNMTSSTVKNTKNIVLSIWT